MTCSFSRRISWGTMIAGTGFPVAMAMLAASAVAVLPVSMAGAAPGKSITVSNSLSRAVGSQRAELTSSDGAANDAFGASVAIFGRRAVVGARDHQVGSNTNQGVAYVFTKTGNTWSQTAQLTASDGAAKDAFGGSVAISGLWAVVGAPGHRVGSNTNQGAGYVFAN